MICPRCGLTNTVTTHRCSCGQILTLADDALERETGAQLGRANWTFALVMLALVTMGLSCLSYACHQINAGAWYLS